MGDSFYLKDHLGKGRAYREALIRHGYTPTEDLFEASFAFFDHDISWSTHKWRPETQYCQDHKIPYFIYPHAARIWYLWDVNEPWPGTRATFIQSPGGREIMKRIGYPTPLEVTGWTYSKILPYSIPQINKKPRVLYGPIHPMGHGYLPLVERALNQKVYQILLELLSEIDLTVRHVRSLMENQLWYDERVTFVEGSTDGSTKEIEEADLVIGPYTFAYLAIAMGKPTLMFGESIPPHTGSRDSNLKWGKKWARYRRFLKYPYNIDDDGVLESAPRVMSMINTSIAHPGPAISWRERFIGREFDPAYFIERLRSYL